MIRNILIHDSSGGELRTLGQTFREAIGSECVVHSVATATELLATVRAGFPYHLVVVELAPGDDEGADFLVLGQRLRELKNIIERAAYRDTTNSITPEHFGLPANDKIDVPAGTFEERVEAFKRTLVMDGYEAASGNQARAARSLGLSYHQYRYYYRKYSQS